MTRLHLSNNRYPKWEVMAATIGLVLALAACAPFGTATITTPSDTSAHNLNVVFIVSQTTRAGKLAVAASYDYHQTFVRFARGERTVCNGTELRFGTSDYSADIPDIAQNRQLECTYFDAQNKATTVAFAVENNPTIISPKEGASIPRTSAFSVTYTTDPTQQVQLEATTFPETLHSSSTGCESSQINGTITCDTTSIPAGPGSIRLLVGGQTVLPNTGFHSASKAIEAWTTINVTWT